MAHWPIGLAAAAAVAVGFAAGAFNGGVSSYLRIPPLVVTLATMALFRGVAMGLSKARSVSSFPESFLRISQGNAFSIPAGKAGPIEVPIPLFALLAVVAIGALLMRRSWIGRFTECIGENETAARFAAIDVRRIKFALYTACGAVCGLAALFNTALYATAKADAATGMELDAIACVVIGGTRISGGQGSVIGSLLGLCIIGILKYGLERAGIRSQHVVIFVGGLLIVTAVFNERMSAASGRSRRGAKS
jgi:rhamnose transport system permease protein